MLQIGQMSLEVKSSLHAVQSDDGEEGPMVLVAVS